MQLRMIHKPLCRKSRSGLTNTELIIGQFGYWKMRMAQLCQSCLGLILLGLLVNVISAKGNGNHLESNEVEKDRLDASCNEDMMFDCWETIGAAGLCWHMLRIGKWNEQLNSDKDCIETILEQMDTSFTKKGYRPKNCGSCYKKQNDKGRYTFYKKNSFTKELFFGSSG